MLSCYYVSMTIYIYIYMCMCTYIYIYTNNDNNNNKHVYNNNDNEHNICYYYYYSYYSYSYYLPGRSWAPRPAALPRPNRRKRRGIGCHYLSNASYLPNAASFVSCVVRLVKDHHNSPRYSPLLRKACVRQGVFDKCQTSEVSPKRQFADERSRERRANRFL